MFAANQKLYLLRDKKIKLTRTCSAKLNIWMLLSKWINKLQDYDRKTCNILSGLMRWNTRVIRVFRWHFRTSQPLLLGVEAENSIPGGRFWLNIFLRVARALGLSLDSKRLRFLPKLGGKFRIWCVGQSVNAKLFDSMNMTLKLRRQRLVSKPFCKSPRSSQRLK